ncbi:MAG: mechanosensitive ion channel [Vicingaceae bacterium]
MVEELKDIWDSVRKALEFELLEFKDYTLSIYNLVVIVLILLLIRLVVKALERLVRRKSETKSWVTEGKQHAVIQIGKYIIYIIGITIALKSVGIDITVLIIGSSALFVGLGFGLQEAFRDFVSGMILLFEGDVMIGDVVEMDNGMVATVKRINLRTSKVRTREGIVVIVPNSQLVNDRVINWSNSNRLTRFEVEVGVAYGSDVRLVEKLLLECGEEEEVISNRIKPFVRFEDFGDSSLDFKLLFWTDQVWRIESTKSRLRFAIDQKFRENNVHIPFPQRDIHFRSSNVSFKE